MDVDAADAVGDDETDKQYHRGTQHQCIGL